MVFDSLELAFWWRDKTGHFNSVMSAMKGRGNLFHGDIAKLLDFI